MGNCMRYLFLALFVVTFVLALPAPVTDRASAQDAARNSDDGDSRGEWGRRGGRGGWQRDRGPGGGRNGDRQGNDGDRPAPPRPAPPAASPPSKTNFGTVSESDKIRKWASDTLARHDKDGNKILEGDELTTLGQSGRESDLNGDGKITSDELFQSSMSKANAASTGTPATPSAVQPKAVPKSTDDSPAERKIINTERKSYRFKSTKERLSTWKFALRDANGDGQVSMHEYASSWTDRTAAEFQRYDQDNDGMITAAEAK
jgi:Ca2+-binding EF-hand superfamily protein